METGRNGLKSLTEVEVVSKGERRRFTEKRRRYCERRIVASGQGRSERFCGGRVPSLPM